MRASEVIFDSEVHFVSEVSPIGEVANLTSLEAKHQTSLLATSLLPKAKTSPLPYHFRAHRVCNTEITSKSCVHIFKEYKAKMAESIEHDNQTKRVCKLACKRASADCSCECFANSKTKCVAPPRKRSNSRVVFALNKKGGSICKNSAVLFTFCRFYGII